MIHFQVLLIAVSVAGQKISESFLSAIKSCSALNTEGISEALLVLPLKIFFIPDYVLCCFISMKYDFFANKTFWNQYVLYFDA